MEAGLQLTTVQLVFVGLLITAGGVQWALFRMVSAAGEKMKPVIEAARLELKAEIDKQAALASKSRHEMMNNVQITIAKLDVEVERLKRESVNRDDMKASEARLSASLERVGTRLDQVFERLAGMPALEKQVQHIDARLTDAIRRLENSTPPQRP